MGAGIIVFALSLPLAAFAGVAGAIWSWDRAVGKHEAWQRLQRTRAGLMTREVGW